VGVVVDMLVVGVVGKVLEVAAQLLALKEAILYQI
jgi:hypothetical protein